ncbi:MAG: hypothetical protein K9J37_02820 [Saprospiraceae bacterium]|nr:hypothetical protein [Saprospiraceae bacterium]MCF8248814.1 hypothetical protein [Saprospiraceae bacterium]MCF8279895.1 hypothetical protein [Bacteroidales bacterium]MCF8310099.1 hypothetical protein [Saprospiraceae bacterium]MCF8438999.1 hypothetical protein [Saprospiraceae bacterium]
MEDKLNQLFQNWQQFGAAVLVAQSEPTVGEAISAEQLIAESTKYCRHSGRLTWVVLDWLIKNKSEINVPELLKATKMEGELAVLGLLANAANEQVPNAVFEKIMKGCKPNPVPDFFFFRIKNSQLASRLTMENPLPIFQKWNFWCNELRYLNQKATA